MALFRVSIYGTIFGQQTCNVLHFQKPDAVEADMTVLANKVKDLWITNPFVLNFNSCQKWNRIHVQRVSNAWTPLDLPVVLQGTWAGTDADVGPVCSVFQLKTAFAGRRGRGRFYMSGFGLGQIQSGAWDTAGFNRLTACANQLKTQWIGGAPPTGFNLMVSPRGTSEADAHAVTNIVVRAYVGVQRRRNFLVGA